MISISFNSFIHENKPGLCVIAIILGMPAIIISILSLLNGTWDNGFTQWAFDLTGNWSFWLIIVGFVLFIPGLYYLVTFIMQLREFRELMTTDSKALFIKNQDRIEELAWRLHPQYEKLVIEKKKKLNVK